MDSYFWKWLILQWTHSCECGKSKNVWVYSCCAVLCMCCFSSEVFLCGSSVLEFWDFQQQDLGKPCWKEPSQAKPSQAISMGSSLSVSCHAVGKKSAFRKEQGWTHSLQCWQCLVAQVCINCLCWFRGMILVCNDYSNCVIMWMTDPIFFIRRLKINHKTHLGTCVCSWDR